jgi:hypothetical protein
MEAQGTDKNADTGQKTLATRLAKEVIDCDPSILSLIVLDKFGRVVAVERSTRLAQADYLSDELVPKFGVLAKLIIGAAGNAVPLMGRMEFIIGAFKNEKVLLVNLHEYEMAVAMRIARSSNAEYVCTKIAERLATTT